jgi:hypothetical protein
MIRQIQHDTSNTNCFLLTVNLYRCHAEFAEASHFKKNQTKTARRNSGGFNL